MSSNKRDNLRSLAWVALAASLAACATTKEKPDPTVGAGLTPIDNYKVAVSESPDEIQLAAHASGLSERQSQALNAFASRWRETGGRIVTIKTPSADGRSVARSVAAIEESLLGLGVGPNLLRLETYDQPAGAEPVVQVTFTRYSAQGPKCGRDWKDFTKTLNNTVNSNFGCATTSNVAAMVANAADLSEPRPMEDADAGRRETVLNKYRQGQITSSAKDDQATGVISQVVH